MLKYVLLLSPVLLLQACATISTPNGGPKDRVPPMLLRSDPESNQKNFQGKSVELYFDESLKLNNPKEEIIISPSPGKDIEIALHNTRVSITPKDGWSPNTTYNIQFREGIQDITEGNFPTNLRLAFSTGPTIDSMYVTGRITNLLKGNNAEKITVALYQQDTFNIFKHSPSYFTKTSKRGTFRIDNIKEGRYFIYAFDDKNKNLRVESKNERFGYAASELVLDKPIDSVQFGVINLDTRPLKINNIRRTGALNRLRFSKAITSYKVSSIENVPTTMLPTQDELLFYLNNYNPNDSLQIYLSAKDSTNQSIDTIFYVKRIDSKTPRETFQWTSGQPYIDPETGVLSTRISYTKPLDSWTPDSLYIRIDTLPPLRIPSSHLQRIDSLQIITLSTPLEKELFRTEHEPEITLIAGKSFLVSIDNDSTKLLKAPVDILWPETTGILILQIQTTEPNYLLQVMNPEGRIVREYNSPKRLTISQLQPGDYKLRFIIDTNKNGRWDPGVPAKRIPPEKVIYYRSAENRASIPIRANWELGPINIQF